MRFSLIEMILFLHRINGFLVLFVFQSLFRFLTLFHSFTTSRSLQALTLCSLITLFYLVYPVRFRRALKSVIRDGELFVDQPNG